MSGDVSYQAVVDALDDAVLLLDRSGVITSANSVAVTMLGLPPSFECRCNVADLLTPRSQRSLLPEGRLTDLGGTATVQLSGRRGRAKQVDVVLRSLPGTSLTLALVRDAAPRLATEQRREHLEHELEFARAVTSNLAAGIVTLDRLGRIAALNGPAQAMLGHAEASVQGRFIHDVIHPDSCSLDPCPLARAARVTTNERVDDDLFVRANGSSFPAAYTISPFAPGHHPVGVVLAFQDMTARREAERRLQESEEMYRTLVQTSADAIVFADTAGRIVTANSQTCTLIGCEEPGAILGRSIFEFVHPDDIDRARAAMQQRVTLAETAGRNIEYRIRRVDGRWVPAEVSSSAVMDGRGRPRGVTLVVRDISARKHAEEALRRSEAGFRLLFARSPLPMWAYDVETGRFLVVNDAALSLYGYSRDAFLRLQTGDIRCGDESALEPLDGTRHEVHRLHDGRSIDVEVSSHLLQLDGRPAVMELAQDITARIRVAAELQRRALHDPLTDLPNRQLFQDRLEQTVRQAQREGNPLAVLFLDLDRFKEINDTLGHHAGDRLLCEAALRIRSTLRESDTVGRLGGDEFAVVLPHTGVDGATETARKIFAALSAPLAIDGNEVPIVVSIGIALYPLHGTATETLLQQADAAMYDAKRSRSGIKAGDLTPA